MAFRAHLSIVLHAHLPFIRHPEHEYHLEELWFYEAMHETYLPLLQMLDRLEDDAVSGAITLSLSAPLLAMMNDELLQERFDDHLDRLVEFSKEDVQRCARSELEEVAQFYLDRFVDLRRYYTDVLDRDIVSAFAHHADTDRLELITCVGTHPVLPFLETDAGRRAQIRAGLDYFETSFGFRPQGIWLPECAFAPGVDDLLAAEQIGYTFVEESAITCAESAPVYGTYAPIISPSKVAFFGRDQFAGAQVWSADKGYPGDPIYREFYRDRGYDLPLDEVRPYIHPDGIRHDTGLKYHRITGDVDLDDKAPYHPDQARSRAREHARHFVDSRINQLDVVADTVDKRSLHITCPYDAELFGHWWFEGPHFLEALLRSADERPTLQLSTPETYLQCVDVHQQTTPATSTWGKDSFFAVWLDDENAWIYRHLRNAEAKMIELADRFHDGGEPQRRILRQMGRELLLAQASDWPFILETQTTVEYAEHRLRDHLAAFETLASTLEAGESTTPALAERENKTNLFPDLCPTHWCSNNAENRR